MVVMMVFKRLFHRHSWRPLKVMYRYRDLGTHRQITVKRCQCQVCGKMEYIHFAGKNIV